MSRLPINQEGIQLDSTRIGYPVNSRYLEVLGTIFYKFNLPEVQINLHFG